jgi:hypothetical protein
VEEMTKAGRWILGGGALAFGAWGVAQPESLASAMGVDRDAARMVGYRDTASGLLIALQGGTASYLVRALFDFGDAALMARRKPKVAAGALGFGLMALAMARAQSDS